MSDAHSSANGDIHVDTVLLKQGANALAALAARLKAAGHQFGADCEARGEAWGDDKGGKKFLAQYKQPHADAEDAGLSGGSVLAESAGQLSDLAAALAAVEEQAMANGKQLAQPNDGA